MKKTILLLALFTSLSSISYAQDNYADTLKKMFKVSGSESSYTAVISQMMTMFKQQYSDVDQEVWTGLEEKFQESSLDDLTEMLVPVYQKYMTIDDLKGMIAFYETPLGKKFANSTPQIMSESMQVGQQWGMKLGQEFQAEMAAKGY